ncbi:Protein CFIM-2 b [Aphelenchoides avenae]|nr:Protein CFIM-2 b [Aphelenchus avenae]
MTDILEGTEGEEYYTGDLDEKELLGEDDDDGIKKEANDDADDLYDAAIEPSGIVEKRESTEGAATVVSSAPPAPTASASASSISSNSGKKFCCYVGNMTWWTTDADLTSLIQSCGADDLVDIKFYENRNNGQSKGFALVVFNSEASVKAIMEKLPTKQIHGQTLVVLPYTKASLAKFEEATRKLDQKDKKDDKAGMVNIGTIRIGTGPPQQPVSLMSSLSGLARPPNIPQTGPQPASLLSLGFPNAGPPGGMNLQLRPPSILSMQPQSLLQRPPVNLTGPPPSLQGNMSRPPPGFPPQMGGVQPPQINLQNFIGRPPSIATTGATGMPPGIPPGAHINPQIYPNFAQNIGSAQSQAGDNGVISEMEFEEIMNRNRTVSSSALTRAVSDAAAGDFSSAIETLVTAISLIRQSRVANDDRCRVLIASLQDTLQGIESKSYSSRKHRSGRDRSRSPSDRRGRKRYRSSRSRSRSRDRYDSYDYSPRHSSRRY